ncbi:MAG: hypothetical protein CVU29_08410 [Betaproteobacteria bacterium HGW-Betaproteobacteria-22]|nr:MAG: hypothetical protein CVU29_08410 [Betaproteobacteria bacterium HGW-Betaproteobacteria-22]
MFGGMALAQHSVAQEAPDALVKRISQEALDFAKADKEIQTGNQKRVLDLVEAKILPYVDFQRMTALAQVSAWPHQEPLPGIIGVLLASLYIMQARITQATLRHDKPDILIQPPLGAVRFMEFDRAEEIIEIGYRSAAGQPTGWTGTPADA